MHHSTYRHTQNGPWHIMLIVFGLGALIAVRFIGFGSWLGAFLLLDAVLLLLLAASFRNLTVENRGDHLRVRFGPLHLIPAKRVPYASIRAVRAARSSLMAGWGIHLGPRGWIWNIYGRDCVELDLDNKHLRIGTDDRDNLLRFLIHRTTV
ncbi:MAG TPA: hypothetical protein QF730_03220 [Planctomycetota bacterium]|jgi:uncharacterized protein (DUF58 family)|nr:hypothetical protein [Planctomycetota bacterium]